LDEPAKFTALEVGDKQNYFSIGGKPTSGSNGYLNLRRGGGHPGRGNSYGFAIVQWIVSERGLYSLTDTIATGPGGNSDGVEIKVFVVKSAEPLSTLTANDMVKVMDNNVLFGDTRFSFDGILGMLPVGARVFVCIGPGPNGNAGADGVSFDFALARGPVAALTPSGTGLASDGPGIPLFGGGTFTTTSVMWSGKAEAGSFNQVLEGTDAPRLASGTYFFTTSAINSYKEGGVLYRVTYASSLFQWTNTVTNGQSEVGIDAHSTGHATNGEQLSFKTVEMPRSSNTRTKFGFTTLKGWDSAVSIRFDFVRLH
jgi:hypothetical protein